MMTADTSGLSRALRFVRKATGKEGAVLLNKALKDVGFQAMSRTPKTTPAEIEAALIKDKQALRIVTARLAGRKGQTYQTKGGKTKRYGRVTRKAIAAQTRRLITQRKRGAGSLRAGFIPWIKAFGGALRGESLRSGGAAAKGYGVRATEATLLAEGVHALYAILDAKPPGSAGPSAKARANIEAAIISAVKAVEADLIAYGERKIGETLAKASDR